MVTVPAVALEVMVTLPLRFALSQSRTWSGVCRPTGAVSTWTGSLLTEILNVSPSAKVQPLVGVPAAAMLFVAEARALLSPFLAAFVSTGMAWARGPYTKKLAVAKEVSSSLVWSIGLPASSRTTMLSVGFSPSVKNFPFLGADKLKSTLLSVAPVNEAFGVTLCASATDFAPPVSAGWQPAQVES